MDVLAVPVINDKPDYKFEIGKGAVPSEKVTDVTIIATGILVANCHWKQLRSLRQMESDAEVINIHTIKPIDEESLS